MMFRSALAFFTRLPVGAKSTSTSLEGIVGYLPLVGIVIGVLVAVFISFATLILPTALCGLLGCLAWVCITGGLHLDGVGDCADALLVEMSPTKRLEIMKDPHLGTFGTTAIFFVLACKAIALAILVEAFFWYGNWWEASFNLLMACCLAASISRCMVFIAIRTPTARPDGLGDTTCRGLESQHEIGMALLTFALCLLNGVSGLLALGVALLVVYTLLAIVKKRLGGVTGDVFGCLIELVECAVLLVLCARL